MTREEREKFVRDTIAEFGFDNGGIRRIVDRWEEDRDEAWNEAIQEGRSIGWSER